MLLVWLFVLGFLASPAAAGEHLFYLHADGVPLATLSEVAPTATALANHDPGRDDALGLLIQRGGAGMAESDPVKYQQWVGTSTGLVLNGRVGFEFWSAMRDFATDSRGVVEAFLLDCDLLGTDCTQIAEARKDIFNWSGGFGSWTRNAIEFGTVSRTVTAGRSLSLKIVVGADSDDDMWFAYDSVAHPSRLTDRAASDTVVDGEFSDWFNSGGTEFVVTDQGGPDDYSNPVKLDITRFGVSSNLVDTFFLLIAFDDETPLKPVAATLIDIDFDNNVDYALVAMINSEWTTVELYSCDGSVTYGCSGATLEMTYPQSYYRMNSAAGPWNDDLHIEIALPFNELGLLDRMVVFTSLVSYSAASLLNSPKDSVLGASGQDYESGIQYDRVAGMGQLIGAVGDAFHIKRHTDPALVRSSADHAVTYDAPFDDTFGTLEDGQNYFYVVEKTGGMTRSLSAHPNPADGSVRIGFNDDLLNSAPVDGFLSKASKDVDSVPADGTSAITVTLVPRDDMGTPLGSGCNVSLDEALLAPGYLAGSVVDNLDGSYTFRIVSVAPGSGTVMATVEGVTLEGLLQVVFY